MLNKEEVKRQATQKWESLDQEHLTRLLREDVVQRYHVSAIKSQTPTPVELTCIIQAKYTVLKSLLICYDKNVVFACRIEVVLIPVSL